MVEYRHYDREKHRACFGEMMDAVKSARPGDVVLLHGCCHNPTGADLSTDQWAEVTRVIAERGLLPFVDIAYQGFGEGLEADAAGLRGLLAACDEVLVAQSCDKNFGVYRDRVGSLWFKTSSASGYEDRIGHVLQISREFWSMPPDHPAAAVRIVLDDPELKPTGGSSSRDARAHRHVFAKRLAAADPRSPISPTQNGMFSMLPLTPEQVLELRKSHAIYMADSGRFNICGMRDDDVDRFASAVLEVMRG
jgi:aspartate/tyrosine/aromatic aminotransferase